MQARESITRHQGLLHLREAGSVLLYINLLRLDQSSQHHKCALSPENTFIKKTLLAKNASARTPA
jgi:hypothetical protein